MLTHTVREDIIFEVHIKVREGELRSRPSMNLITNHFSKSCLRASVLTYGSFIKAWVCSNTCRPNKRLFFI